MTPAAVLTPEREQVVRGLAVGPFTYIRSALADALAELDRERARRDATLLELDRLEREARRESGPSAAEAYRRAAGLVRRGGAER